MAAASTRNTASSGQRNPVLSASQPSIRAPIALKALNHSDAAAPSAAVKPLATTRVGSQLSSR